jgi:hypothetical protein
MVDRASTSTSELVPEAIVARISWQWQLTPADDVMQVDLYVFVQSVVIRMRHAFPCHWNRPEDGPPVPSMVVIFDGSGSDRGLLTHAVVAVALVTCVVLGSCVAAA